MGGKCARDWVERGEGNTEGLWKQVKWCLVLVGRDEEPELGEKLKKKKIKIR